MILDSSDFKVTSDNHQFTLYAKEEIKDGPKVKPENVGKIREVFIGHYTKFDWLVKGAIKHELSKCSVLTLQEISDHINSVASQFESVKR